MTLTEVQKIHDVLNIELHSKQPSLTKCADLLTKAKLLLVPFSFLVPPDTFHPSTASSSDMKAILLTREILELGTLYAVHARDIPQFEQYWCQLSTYYHIPLAESPRRYMLHGLYLLSLLAQNRMAEFHAVLERIPSQDLGNLYIRHCITLEQALMEGSYNKVWHTREDVPAKECLFFIDILMETVRNEIASCAMTSYTSIPLQDAMTLLFFTQRDDLLRFCQAQPWTVHKDAIHFAAPTVSHAAKDTLLDTSTMMGYALHYARELEKIV